MFKKIFLLLFLNTILISCVKETDNIDKSEPPSAPKELKTIFKKETSVAASWEVPNNLGRLENGDQATITEYVVQASRTPGYAVIEKELRTKDTTIDINDLTGEGTNYYFRVIAKNASNIPESVPSTTYLGVVGTPLKSEAPGRPLSLKIKQGTLEGRRVSLEWIIPKDTGKLKDGIVRAEIISYRVQYAKSDDFTDDLVTVDIEDVISEVIINDLEPLMTYYARVLSRNNNGDSRKEYSMPSAILTFRTNRLTSSPPDAPKGLSETEVTSSSIGLSWVVPEAPGKLFDGESAAEITGYEILYSKSSDFSSDNMASQVNVSDANTATINNLTPYTRYYISIRAFNNNGDDIKSKSSYSPQILGGVITAKPDGADEAERPNDPTNITVSDITESQAMISWDAPDNLGRLPNGSEANIREYIVEYSDNSAFTDVKIESVQVGTSITLTGLSPSTSYFVRIKTRNNNRVTGLDTSDGALLDSGFSTLFPTPPSSPGGVIVSVPEGNLGKTTLAISWQASGDFGLKGNGDPAELQKYIVQYSTDKFATPSAIQSVYVTTGTMKNITGLSPNKTYSIRVLAENSNPDSGEGSQNTSFPSEIVDATTRTDKSPPTAPTLVTSTEPEVYIEGQTKRVISWQEPASSGKTPQGTDDTIKNYILQYVVDTEDFDNSSTITLEGTETTTTLVELTVNTAYKFRVFAINNNDSDEFSKSADMTVYSFTTNDLREPPAVPQNLTQVVNATQVTISFDAPTNTGKNPAGETTPLVGYEYKFVEASIAETELQSVMPTVVSRSTPANIVVSDLKPKTQYSLYLRVANGNTPDRARYSEYVKYDGTTTAPQIATESVSYEFTYEEHLYYVVNDPKTWQEAVALATSNGGYLVEINSLEEQQAIQTAMGDSNFAFNSNAIDGGGTPHIWIGATDSNTEGTWVWNGDNVEPTSPLGVASVNAGSPTTVTWTPSSDIYSNWLMLEGNQVQPDNSTNLNSPMGQNYGAISINDNYKWVDLNGDNNLPLIIEIGKRK